MQSLYPQDFIERVKSANDIVGTISSYLPLKKSGANYVALCPFHTEKTPSFSVSHSKQIFHCFGCGEGGNVISFVMKYENLPFVDAMKQLAERAGIPTPHAKEERELTRLYDVNREAAAFYRQRLKTAAEKSTVAEYVKKRAMDAGTLELFGIGYAPDSWDACLKHLGYKKFSAADMAAAGIIKKSSTGNYIDTFRNRLIFPISNEQGRIIAFAGRRLSDDKGPKYLNSPESRVYSKSRVVYGLKLAAEHIRKADQILVVEGYTDLISLYQSGIKNAVATAGTAFTPYHCRMLTRYTKRIVMVFDGDDAGKKAASRATKIAMEHQVRPLVVMLKTGTDPDDIVKSAGPEAFRKLVDEAKPYMSYMIELACGKYDVSSAEGRADAARSLLPDLAEIRDPIERASYVETISQKLKIPASKIESRIGTGGGEKPRQSLRKTGQSDTHKMEKIMIRILIDHPEIVETKLKELKPEDFQNPLYRRIFKTVIEHGGSESGTRSDIMENIEDEELRRAARTLAMENRLYEEEYWDKNVDDFLSHIRLRTRKSLYDRMLLAAKEGKHEDYLKYQKTYRELN